MLLELVAWRSNSNRRILPAQLHASLATTPLGEEGEVPEVPEVARRSSFPVLPGMHASGTRRSPTRVKVAKKATL